MNSLRVELAAVAQGSGEAGVLRVEVESLRGAVVLAEAKVVCLEKALAAQEDAMAVLQGTKVKLERHVEALQSQLAQAREQMQALSCEVESLGAVARKDCGDDDELTRLQRERESERERLTHELAEVKSAKMRADLSMAQVCVSSCVT